MGNPTIGLYHGYGTHLDPQVAVIRAICEAAQGRLVYIAGSRDDAFGHHRRFRTTFAEANETLLTAGHRRPDDVHDDSGPTFEADGRTLLSRLRGIGVPRVLAVDLTHPDIGVDVFRVVVPGLEGYMLQDFTPDRGPAWLAPPATRRSPSHDDRRLPRPDDAVVQAPRILPDAVFLPPAAQSDIISVVDELSPDGILLIDGVFTQQLSVWHKEILYALERGVAVYGSSSMGALRVAETAAYGARGFGAIFDAYASGELTDDDEVAVAHAGAEWEFRSLSDAMVNIRQTLRRGGEAGVLDADQLA